MNKLQLPGRVWLASDMHLGPESPHTNRAFQTFLSQAAQHADALVLGGDIFNVWVGDDIIHAPPAWLAELLLAMHHATRSIPLYVCRGNRDFLMGQRFCDHIDATLLDDQTILVTDAGALLFSHGDEYCTDDRRYQRFRRWVRKTWVQRIFLLFSLARRQKWAGYARARSIQANRQKQYDIMDVNEAAVRTAMKLAAVQVMVHGHTHRPAIHRLTDEAGNTLNRIVLPDWDYDTVPGRGGWLAVDAAGWALKTLTP